MDMMNHEWHVEMWGWGENNVVVSAKLSSGPSCGGICRTLEHACQSCNLKISPALDVLAYSLGMIKEVVSHIGTILKTTLTTNFHYKSLINLVNVYFLETTFQDKSIYITFIFSNSTQTNLFIVKL